MGSSLLGWCGRERCALPYKISMKLPAAKVPSFSGAGVNGRCAVDWLLSANSLKPSDNTGRASLAISNAGAIEAIDGIIQLAKRRARGFRNFSYLRTIAYWVAAKL